MNMIYISVKLNKTHLFLESLVKLSKKLYLTKNKKTKNKFPKMFRESTKLNFTIFLFHFDNTKDFVHKYCLRSKIENIVCI